MKLRALLFAATLLAPFAHAQTSAPATDPTWWKHAVLYEIYPRSFQDTNGDGTGDLNGITSRLDYLQSLGIDAIWIAPMYPSPQIDFGYDISDYKAVDPQYGTMADMDRLLAEAKKRNIRILLDFVLNHTSDQHAWFKESASSKTNPKRDWYIWRDGKMVDGKLQPPNNWVSIFGGSAWQLDPKTNQFYYHAFYKQQPDLNWRNPAVEKAMFDTLRFWLDKGVAGFRLDAVPELFEDPNLKDDPLTGKKNAYGDDETTRANSTNLPAVHDVMKRMRSLVDSYNDGRVLVGETYLPNIAEMDKWYGGEKKDELHLPMDMLVGFKTNKLDIDHFRTTITDVETGIHGSQPLLVFSNHDRERDFDRYGDGTHNLQIAKLLAAILFTTRSTALMYYGEELGMTTETPTRKEDVKDPIGISGWPQEKGRDGERTPMQWNGTELAGFTTVTPWLPIPANHVTVNVVTEEADKTSLLNWYKQLIALRRTNRALRNGSMTMTNITDHNVLSWIRQTADGKTVLTALNMTAQPQTFTYADKTTAKTLATSDPALADATTTTITLAPYTSWIADVK